MQPDQINAMPCKACGNPDPVGFSCDVCGAELFDDLPPDPGADTRDVPGVPHQRQKTAPLLAGTLERLERELNSPPLSFARYEGESPGSFAASSICDVPDVPDVPASNGAGFGGTASEKADVPDVPALAELIECATTEGSDKRQSDPFPATHERPCYCVLDDWADWQGRRFRPGVYWCTAEEDATGTPQLSELWFCSPIHIEAITFDAQSNNFGRMLRFRNSLGKWRAWAMPMELLRGSGEELRGELLSMGVELDPNKARQQLPAYLQRTTPKRQMHCALQVGWCGNAFVLPDVVVGPNAAGVIFQTGERAHDEHTQAGTLDGWRAEIAARAVQNPLFLLALSAAFAGPLLKLTNTEGGGLHFVGDSSTGKTTILEAACSVWGGTGYRRSWRATANGMEGAAALFNDCLLALDEISEAEPKEVGAIVYALGNGRGKQRASRSGAARSVTRWQAFIVSTGERTIATTMQEGGQRAKAGQSVRLLDIPASRRFGCFDELHGMESGTALSDAIKRAAAQQHGRPGRAFLERLAHDGRDMAQYLEKFKAQQAFNPDEAEGQDKRAASRFALLALAGELATEYGITGWPEGAAYEAARTGFRLWRSMRGKGNDERRQVLDRLSGFIERHGDSRFSDWTDDKAMIRDRAGWWKPDDQGGRVYLFNSEGLREALKGFDFKRALDVLEAAGAIPKASATGERSKTENIGGRKVRAYQVRADALTGVSDGA